VNQNTICNSFPVRNLLFNDYRGQYMLQHTIQKNSENSMGGFQVLNPPNPSLGMPVVTRNNSRLCVNICTTCPRSHSNTPETGELNQQSPIMCNVQRPDYQDTKPDCMCHFKFSTRHKPFALGLLMHFFIPKRQTLSMRIMRCDITADAHFCAA